nr:immunoglobulin light chain junction region [Macaca mulatta]
DYYCTSFVTTNVFF